MEIDLESVRCYSSLSLNLTFKKWVIVGKHKNEDRPFRVDSLTVHWEPTVDLAYIPPHINVHGVWAQKGGYKWGTRGSSFPGWHGGGGQESIKFETLPSSIKVFIYNTVIKETLAFAGALAQQLSLLTTNKEFVVNPDAITAAVNGAGVFLPSITPSSLYAPSKWENMDVSKWSVARKELK